ncbi:MAG: hypothetical protein MK097_08425 [Dechloromonas sp.]|nr:hypothetical protein [Dechloromonas sp.]
MAHSDPILDPLFVKSFNADLEALNSPARIAMTKLSRVRHARSHRRRLPALRPGPQPGAACGRGSRLVKTAPPDRRCRC